MLKWNKYEREFFVVLVITCFYIQKAVEHHILTSIWSGQHPNACWNLQQSSLRGDDTLFYKEREKMYKFFLSCLYQNYLEHSPQKHFSLHGKYILFILWHWIFFTFYDDCKISNKKERKKEKRKKKEKKFDRNGTFKPIRKDQGSIFIVQSDLVLFSALFLLFC